MKDLELVAMLRERVALYQHWSEFIEDLESRQLEVPTETLLAAAEAAWRLEGRLQSPASDERLMPIAPQPVMPDQPGEKRSSRHVGTSPA